MKEIEALTRRPTRQTNKKRLARFFNPAMQKARLVLIFISFLTFISIALYCAYYAGTVACHGVIDRLPPIASVAEPFIYVTGRFGYGSRFRQSVSEHCAYALSWMRPEDTLVCNWMFPSYIRTDPRWASHLRFLEVPSDISARGAGYWFWKPLLLNHTMRGATPNQLILYSDTDQDHIFEYANSNLFKTFLRTNATFAIEQMSMHLEKTWTKEDTLHAFNATQDQRNSGQYRAGVILLRNTIHNQRMMDEWGRLMQNWHLLTDEPSIRTNDPSFKGNRHDQSFLSMLIKKHIQQRNIRMISGGSMKFFDEL